MGMASRVLTENRGNLAAYLKLFEYLDENNVKAEDLSHAVGLAHNIGHMKKEKAQIEFEIDTLMDTKLYFELELDKLKSKYYKIQ
jgi:hypothetical protein